MSEQVLVRDLWKTYGAVAAVRGLGFTVEAGEIFGLLGPNGAGKTTTLECVVGLREPDRGEVRIAGHDARQASAEVKQRLGVALQRPALPDAITTREALRLFGSCYRRRVSPETLLAEFELTPCADVRFSLLSGGQQQRLALALAMVNSPAVVVLDEPTAGLDPRARQSLQAMVARLKAGGAAVLLATHDLAEAEALCDRVAILDRGRIVAQGTPAELAAGRLRGHVVRLRAGAVLDAAALRSLPGVRDLEVDGAAARFGTDDATAAVAALTNWLAARGIALLELQVRRASLEELFLALTEPTETSESPRP